MTQLPHIQHSFLTRLTHWLMTLAFLALLLSGVEIIISHPRFYWGEVGNVNTQPLFKIPIPASRKLVPTGYPYVLPDRNGWSRNLHFESAWVVILTGLVYVVAGFWSGHFKRDLAPARQDLSFKALAQSIATHALLKKPAREEAWSYNVLQRIAYLLVIFVLFPMMTWTGLAMSPSFVSAVPATVNLLGGQQSARSLHFFLTVGLVAFVTVHLLMLIRVGFRQRMRAMVTGRSSAPRERT